MSDFAPKAAHFAGLRCANEPLTSTPSMTYEKCGQKRIVQMRGLSHGVEYHSLFYKDLRQILGIKIKKSFPT